MNNVVLEGRNLTFAYDSQDSTPVFENVSLSLHRGEAVLLMGPSGCGKSTLAYCLAGLYPEYGGKLGGKVLVHGKPIRSLGPAARSKMVSILFQNPDNQFCMDRVDNEVLFALENINEPGDLRLKMRELLARVGLAESETQLIRKLSGGMKQKLALCTALATGARILILDEPFANLDPASCRELAVLLGDLKAQSGISFLIVDHKPRWWRAMVDRVVIMEREGALDSRSIPAQQLDTHASLFAEKGIFLNEDYAMGHHPAPIPDAEKIMVETRDLKVLFDKKQVFMEGLNLRLEKGSVTALIGSCGSGKTSILLTLAGVLRHAGQLKIHGRAGLVFQNPRFQFLTLTVEDEVRQSIRISRPKLPAEETEREIARYLEEFGLLKLRKNSPYAISQGQQRRLALLSMLICDCPLMLLDEPTYAQDEKSTKFIMNLLDRRIADGLTVVMATHDLKLARAYANRVYLVKDRSIRELTEAEMEAYDEDD